MKVVDVFVAAGLTVGAVLVVASFIEYVGPRWAFIQ